MEVVDSGKLYKYKPISNAWSIRLLELLPGLAESPLRCKLFEVRLNQWPAFEAISYTWGEARFPRCIEEIESSSSIPITQNLHDAFQALRFERISRFLWVDAVCIDQQNITEKNLQVPLMGDIYRKAGQVVVWLGEQDCGKGLDELERIGGDCELYGLSEIMPTMALDFVLDQAVFQQCADLAQQCDGDALLPVFQNEWYHRVWTVQEFVLANILVLQCGGRSIEYDNFSRAVSALMYLRRIPNLSNTPTSASLNHCLRCVGFFRAWKLVLERESYWMRGVVKPARGFNGNEGNPRQGLPGSTRQGLPLHNDVVLSCMSAGELRCADERDRLYGMLAIATGDDGFSIQVEYESPAEKIWNDLAVKLLLLGNLDVLHYAGIPPEGKPRTRSFAPDFGQILYNEPRFGGSGVSAFQAGTQAPVHVRISPEGTPQLRAVKVGTVKDRVRVSDTDSLTVSENDSATSPSTANTAELEQRKPPTIRRSLKLILEWWISQHVSAGRSVYTTEANETDLSVFARTVVADNDMVITHTFIGRDNHLLELYLVLSILAREYSERGLETRVFVPDADVAHYFGRAISCEVAMLPDGSATVYHFPSDKPPDAIIESPDGTKVNLVEIKGPLRERLKWYKKAVSAVLGHRCLFTTSKGLLGIGPWAMEPGDDVVIFEGAQTPFVIRRADPNGGEQPGMADRAADDAGAPIRCTLVGDSYVHGIMHGSVMEVAMKPEYADRWVDIILV